MPSVLFDSIFVTSEMVSLSIEGEKSLSEVERCTSLILARTEFLFCREVWEKPYRGDYWDES